MQNCGTTEKNLLNHSWQTTGVHRRFLAHDAKTNYFCAIRFLQQYETSSHSDSK